MRMLINNRRITNGFTLIELVIVIAIISVLSIFVLSTLDPISQFQKANDGRRKSDLSQVQKALETYYQDNGRYPDNPAAGDYRIKDLSGNAVDWGQDWSPYMIPLPKDPNSSKNYVYYAGSDGQSYYIYASLDRGAKDPQACNNGAVCANVPAVASCGNSVCNYGVSSPNVSP